MLKEFGYAVRTDNITSFPNNINSNSGSIIDYSISGDMVQKSENLWNEDYTGISTTIKYVPIYVGDGVFTMSSTTPISTGSAATLFFLSGNVSSGASTATNGVYLNNPKTISSTDGYVTVAFRTYTTDTPVGQQTMLNKGLTALPYVPYNPTPTYPITPIEVGDKTDNLFDGTLIGGTFKDNEFNMATSTSTTVFKSIKIFLSAGTYTFSWGKNVNVIRLVIDNVYSQIGDSQDITSYTITSTTDNYVGISFRDTTSSSTDWDMSTYIMLNKGSTALPYEPYGYKININTNNIYLNEPLYGIGDYKDTIDVTNKTLTRKIKKLVLTGNETLYLYKSGASGVGFRTDGLTDMLYNGRQLGFCSHFQPNVAPVGSAIDGVTFGDSSNNIYFVFSVNSVNTLGLSDLSSITNWLKLKYNNGTPVIVYYVLATPTTENITIPSTLTNNIEGYLTQTGTPTPTNPIYPTYNGTLNKNNTYTITTNIGTDNIIYTSEPIRKLGNYSDVINSDGSITRVIKKYICTGNEIIGSESNMYSIQGALPQTVTSWGDAMCSHFVKAPSYTDCNGSVRGLGKFGLSIRQTQTAHAWFNKFNWSDTASFKTFLQTQYQNNTPVTIWYPLQTPTTDTTITTPPTINTIKGINTINNNNTLSPSNIRLKYNKGDWLEIYYRQIEINNITSNTLPMYFNSDSDTIGSYNIKGDMNQDENSSNLFFSDRSYTNTASNATIIQTENSAEFTVDRTATETERSNSVTINIIIPAGDYTIAVDGLITFDGTHDRIYIRKSDGTVLKNNIQTGYPQHFTVTETTIIDRVVFIFRASSTYTNQKVRVWLVKGTYSYSDIPPYEPYGKRIPTPSIPVYPNECGDIVTTGDYSGYYKIPIELNNIYINNPLCAIGTYKDSLDLSTGVVTRNIKKLVLTGEEHLYNDWRPYSGTYAALLFIESDSDKSYSAISDITTVCSHINSSTYSAIYDGTIGTSTVGGATYSVVLRVPNTVATDETTFRAWLANQYNAGTPVTVWYILNTPTTETTTIPYTLTGTIDGYLIQNGTPSPSNPIYPISNGTETKNLFDGIYQLAYMNANGVYYTNISNVRTALIPCKPNTSYCIKRFVGGNRLRIAVYTTLPTNNTQGTILYNDSTVDSIAITTLSDSTYLAIYVAEVTSSTESIITEICEGNTIPVIYEPYGYKLPAYTTNIYTKEPIRKIGNYSDIINSDGTVTRNIYEMIFKGNETIYSANGQFYMDTIIPDYIRAQDVNLALCSHYPTYPQTNLITNVPDYHVSFSYASSTQRLYMCDSSCNGDVTTFKTWLTNQYNNGTPMKVWYVLAEPQTETITNPNLPLLIDENTLDINTKLKPSEVTIGAKQWVNKVPKIYINNKWTYNWTTFRELVRSGKAQDVFPVGTILYDTWGDDTSTAFQIVSYNTHYNTDLYNEGYTNSVTLCEEKVRYGVPFDSVEAMMYVTTAMPVGGYKFTIPNYDATYGGNKTYYFETTQEVPVGGQICLEWRYQTVPRTIRTYASNTSTTVLDSYGTSSSPLPEWDSTTYPDAIDLGTVTLSTTATTGTYGIFNHIHRARYGSNNYLQSRIRQYMNGTTNWWTPQTIFDRPTDWSVTTLPTNGLLNILDTDLTNILTTPTITTTANNTFEYQSLDGTTFTLNSSYTINTDKLFLLSHTEVNLSATPNSGTILDYYINATNDKRIKYDITNASTARYWWFRTPYPSYAGYTRDCNSTGALSNSGACFGIGCVPACVIQ